MHRLSYRIHFWRSAVCIASIGRVCDTPSTVRDCVQCKVAVHQGSPYGDDGPNRWVTCGR